MHICHVNIVEDWPFNIAPKALQRRRDNSCFVFPTHAYLCSLWRRRAWAKDPGSWLIITRHRQSAAQTKNHNAHKQLQHAVEKLHQDARSQQETRAKYALAGCVQSFPNAWYKLLEAYTPAHLRNGLPDVSWNFCTHRQ